MISFRNKLVFDKDALIVCVTQEQVKNKAFLLGNATLNRDIRNVSVAGQFSGKKGEIFPLVLGKKVVLLLGMGKEQDVTMTSLRILLRRVLLSSYLRMAKTIEILPFVNKEEVARAVVEAIVIGTYSWKKYITLKADDKTPQKKNYVVITSDAKAAQMAVHVAECTNFTRDLINENADIVTPQYLEKQVRSLVKGQKNVKLEVLDQKKLQAKGLGLLLAVNQGSNKEPRVVIATYTGAGKNVPYTAIIGKGVTFDSGGLNLKPSGHMETMRMDMSGAGVVWGTLKAILTLKPKKNIVFAAGMVENAIDAHSYKPGDVIKGYAGKTVEVGNTDAEGRLVLADVLAYVEKNYKPAKMIDLATLTGACVSALGYDYAAILGSDDKLIKALLDSATTTDDRAWQLPMYPEYKDAIKSKIADVLNISNARGAAGTVCGAEFLKSFIGKTPWAHIDIAGTAWVDGGSRWYYAHGATGYGVRLLVDYLMKN